jgi:hypothetical protein
MWKVVDLCSQIFVINLGKFFDEKQLWKEKFHATNGKGSTCNHELSSFFLLRVLGEKDFPPSPPLVLNVFPSSSQNVPEDVSNSTWVLSHTVCPKFNPNVYKLKRWNLRDHMCFYFATRVQRGASIRGMYNVPILFFMDQSIWFV